MHTHNPRSREPKGRMKLLPESLQQEAATAALVAGSVLVRVRARLHRPPCHVRTHAHPAHATPA